MSLLFAIILLGVSIAAFIALFRRLRRHHAALGTWMALAVFVVCGVSVGVWCALYSEYPVGGRLRFGSFPVPVVVFHLEDGNWVDFPLDAVVAWPIIIINIITVTALATLPVWLKSKKARG